MKLAHTPMLDIKNSNIKYYRLSGEEEKYLAVMRDDAVVITLNSGTQVFMTTKPVQQQISPNRISYTVDINGFKKTNKFGRDVFCFTISANGVNPSQWDDYTSASTLKTRAELLNGPSSGNYNCAKWAKGTWCAVLIMFDG